VIRCPALAIRPNFLLSMWISAPQRRDARDPRLVGAVATVVGVEERSNNSSSPSARQRANHFLAVRTLIPVLGTDGLRQPPASKEARMNNVLRNYT
jgi:hypothetical protein